MQNMTDHEIEELRGELDKARRNAEEVTSELDLLLYSISHDLRAPLRAIDGFSEILLEDYHDLLDEEGKRYLGIIRDNSRKIDRHIQAVLALARLGRRELQPAPLDMNSIAAAAVNGYRINNPDRTISFKMADLQPAVGDRQMIREVLDELVDNAAKATRRQEQPQIRIAGEQAGRENIYSVSDNGIGFDMQYADKLFGVFQKLHTPDVFDGDGVGLAKVRRIIGRHGGRVWAAAAPDQGAAFFFTLKAIDQRPLEP